MKQSPIHNWLAESTGLGTSLSPASLLRFQLERLRETLEYARSRSKFYENTLRGIPLAGISDLAALEQIPFTTPDDIRREGTRMVCVSQQHIARIITLSTSGTSGQPKRLFFSEKDLLSCVDFFECGMRTMVAAGDTVRTFLGEATPGGTVDLLRQGLDRVGATTIIHTISGDMGARLADPSALEATCYVGLAWHMLQTARANPALRPRNVLLCADYVPDAVAAAICDTWQCEVFTHYGSTESCLAGGVECNAHNGYHGRDADLLFEVVDPATGKQVPDGQYGELVFTTLGREAMPLIRYRTGDTARILNTPCPCGSPLRRVDKVMGRYSSVTPLPGGPDISIHQLDELLFSLPDVLDYRAGIAQDGTLCLAVRRCAPGGGTTADTVRKRLEEAFQYPLPVRIDFTAAPFPPAQPKRVLSREAL